MWASSSEQIKGIGRDLLRLLKLVENEEAGITILNDLSK